MGSQPHPPDFGLLTAMPFRDRVEFGAIDTAPRFARKRAATVLAEWGLAGLEYPAGMIISELVTNSMQATRQAWPAGWPPIRVWMRGDPSAVYVLVHDAVPRPPQPREASDVAELAESGRGLAIIVPEFSAESGWYPTGDGKVTWALIGNPVTRLPGLAEKAITERLHDD
jgi:hypothetical protein